MRFSKDRAFHDNRAMQIHGPNIWWLRTSTLVLAALAAGSATFWALRFMAPAAVLPSPEISVGSAALANPLGIARLLGGGRTEGVAPALDNAVANPLKLLGIVASPSERGYALIAVGPLPAKGPAECLLPGDAGCGLGQQPRHQQRYRSRRIGVAG